MNLAAVLKPKPLVAAVALTLLVLALALPGIRSVPVTDRDEARYAQASKQMVESGDYVQIRFLDEARNKKPAGIYWLHTLSVRLTGVKDEIWPYRLVSVFGALLAVLLLYLLAQRIQPETPLLPVVALAVCPLLVVVEHAATTDAVMLATVCAAQLCLARVYLGGKCQVAGGKGGEFSLDTRHSTLSGAIGFWIAIGIGILVKGPIAPLIAGLTILALCLHDRNVCWLRRLRPLSGMFILLLIVLPWLVAIQRKTDFLQESVGKDFLSKIFGAQESHGAPPGIYLLAANFLFWPLFPLAWRGIGSAWQVRCTDPVARFLLAWLLPAWLVFELVPTKLPHYVLPLYPVLAFLAVRRWVGQGSSVEGGGWKGGCEQNFVGNFVDQARVKVNALGPGRAGATVARARPEPSAESPNSVSLGARLWRVSCHVVDVVWWLGAAAFVIGPVLAARLLGWEWMPAAFGCAAVAGAAIALVWWLRRQPTTMVAVAAGFVLLYFTTLFAVVLPRLDDLWLTRNVADMVATQTQGRPARVVSVGYSEPSMAFTFGTQTVLAGGVERAVQELQQNPSALVLIQDAPASPRRLLPVGDALWERLCQRVAVSPKNRHREQFLATAARAGVRVREVASVDGFNYSRTQRVRVILYRNAECGMRSVETGTRNAECGMRNAR